MLSMVVLRSQKLVPPPTGMEIEITDFEHAMPLPDPSVSRSDAARNETVPETQQATPAASQASEQRQQPTPSPEPRPSTDLTQTVPPLPVPPVETPAPPKVDVAPVLAPAPVSSAPPVLVNSPPPMPQPVRVVSPSPGPAAVAAPATPVRRLDATALSRSLAVKTGDAPRSRLNSAAIGSVIGQAVPKGVAGLTVRQRANLVEMIRSQITPCWNPPESEDKSGHVSVLMRIRLDRAGGVLGTPAVSRVTGRTSANEAYANALSGSVRRAVLRCAPLKLPAELYDAWADVELNFDPKDVS
jgi:hypothetical protein